MNQLSPTYRFTRAVHSRFENLVISNGPRADVFWVRFLRWVMIVDFVIISAVMLKLFYFERTTPVANASEGLYMLKSAGRDQGMPQSIPQKTLGSEVDLSSKPKTSAFIANLHAMNETPTIVRPMKRSTFGIDGNLITINGDNIQVFEYQDNATANNIADKLNTRFMSSARSTAWKKNMHVYVDGSLVIFYMGGKEPILTALEPLKSQPTLSTALHSGR